MSPLKWHLRQVLDQLLDQVGDAGGIPRRRPSCRPSTTAAAALRSPTPRAPRPALPTGAAPPTLSDAIEHDTDRCVFSLAATRPATAALPGAAKPTAVLEYARLGNGDLDLYARPPCPALVRPLFSACALCGKGGLRLCKERPVCRAAAVVSASLSWPDGWTNAGAAPGLPPCLCVFLCHRSPIVQATHVCPPRHAGHGRCGAAVPLGVCARARRGRARRALLLVHFPGAAAAAAPRATRSLCARWLRCCGAPRLALVGVRVCLCRLGEVRAVC